MNLVVSILMKKLVLILALISLSANARMFPDSFIHVTIDNDHGIQIKVEEVKDHDDLYRIKLPRFFSAESYRQAYLIISRKPLSKEEQDFRKYFYNHIGRDDILLISPINTLFNKSILEDENGWKYVEIILEKDIAKRAYIYLDNIPLSVPGDYFSIDIGTFIDDLSNY